MTAKQKLMERIQNLTPEQAEKILSRIDLLERCIAMTDAQATFTATLTGKLFGKWGEQNMKEAYIEKINEEMSKTEDVELLDLIYKLLVNSHAEWAHNSINTAMLPVGGVAVKFWVNFGSHPSKWPETA